MAQIKPYFFPGILLFTIGILAAVFAQFYPEEKILTRMLLACVFLYLGLGWYVFRQYFPLGNILILFLMGLFYSSVLMSALFCAAQWPLYGTFSIISLFWAAAVLLLVFVQRKFMTREIFVQFLIEGSMLAALAIMLVVRN